jgi:hypothetical protein
VSPTERFVDRARCGHHVAAHLTPAAEAVLSNRWLSWLLGPEAYWLGIYLASRLLAASTTPGDAAGIKLLERSSFIVPAVAVPLAFAIFYWLAPAPASRGWLTFRMLAGAGRSP